MTVNECYERAVSFLPEIPNDNPDLQKHMVNWCNMLLADTFNAENTYRKENGQDELFSPPVLTEQDDFIPYNETLVTMAFPYGMARWVLRDNDEIAESRMYYNLFAQAVSLAVPAYTSDVEDMY